MVRHFKNLAAFANFPKSCEISKNTFFYRTPLAAFLIITILHHIENPGIVKTVYSGIFRDIQQYSAMLKHIEEH